MCGIFAPLWFIPALLQLAISNEELTMILLTIKTLQHSPHSNKSLIIIFFIKIQQLK